MSIMGKFTKELLLNLNHNEEIEKLKYQTDCCLQERNIFTSKRLTLNPKELLAIKGIVVSKIFELSNKPLEESIWLDQLNGYSKILKKLGFPHTSNQINDFFK